MFGYFHRHTVCPEIAADLAAQTFAEALASIGRYDAERGAPRAWLFGIANNVHRQWARRALVRKRASARIPLERLRAEESGLDRVEQLVDLDPLRQAILMGLQTLSPEMRTAVVLRVCHQMTYREVAARIGCSEINARVRVSRALRRLGEAVGPRSEALSGHPGA